MLPKKTHTSHRKSTIRRPSGGEPGRTDQSSIPLTGEIFYEGFFENETERYFFTESLDLALEEQQRMLREGGVKIEIVEWKQTILRIPLLIRTWFIDNNNKVNCTKD